VTYQGNGAQDINDLTAFLPNCAMCLETQSPAVGDSCLFMQGMRSPTSLIDTSLCLGSWNGPDLLQEMGNFLLKIQRLLW
jgi:hypothetical protein